jgi:hypothetical protein
VHAFVNDLERPIGTYLYGRRMYETMVFWETVSTGVDQPAAIRDFAEISRLHPLIPRETLRWHKLYRGRAAVEREFGRLKNEWSLLPLRVRGLERVQLHADLTILAKLSCALARARAVPLAA